MHVAFYRPIDANPDEPGNAYDRQYTRLRMKDLFNQQAPAEF